MRIRRSVQVAAGPDEVRNVLTGAETFARCLPGATAESAAGDSVSGRFMVRIGGHQITYGGTVTRSDGLTLLWRGTATQLRGEGEVTASLSFTTEADPGGSTLAVDARLTGTGRVADFDADERRTAAERLLERLLQAIAYEVARSAATETPADPIPSSERSIQPVPSPGHKRPVTSIEDKRPVASPDRSRLAAVASNGHAPIELRRQLPGVPIVAALVGSITVLLFWLLRRLSVRH